MTQEEAAVPSNTVKASVMIITYNHESFIAKAVESALAQKTNFRYEIVIGEDCSTDGTRAILESYRERFPEKIRLVLNERNLGPNTNASQTCEACRGDYIALLEGDDYWVSPEKLQKQVDLLDNHPECAFCFTNALVVCRDGSYPTEVYCRPDQKAFSTVEDLLERGNFIPSCSAMYRRGLVEKEPEWVAELKMTDWPIHVLNALHGSIAYIDEIMAVYVVHKGGIWFHTRQDWEETNKANIEFYERFYDYLKTTHGKIIRPKLRHLYYETATKHIEAGSRVRAKVYAKRWLRKDGIGDVRLLKLLFYLYTPLLYKCVKTMRKRTGTTVEWLAGGTTR